MPSLKNKIESGAWLQGRYKTISPLNHGSFGMVFMAEDLVTQKIVALKCITKKPALDNGDSEFPVDDLSEELAIHKRLGSHPNIVNILDSFDTDDYQFLVLEFCSRGDLYEAIRHGDGPLDTEHVRRFMLELIDAVEHMHMQGVFHRDIKPENIFLTESGVMKLGDFGLATTVEWSTEIAVGSDRYMSPEQYEPDNTGYSPAQADIWAIGICLLNVLFSRNPFTVPTTNDPVFFDYTRDSQSLFDVFPEMSQDTYEVITKCMNLDPKKRSLRATREAVLRAVSFTTTTEDELDTFHRAERRSVPTANREPLRTPSIQTSTVDHGHFPWSHAIPQSRTLSVIPDAYEDDLFSKSFETQEWNSVMDPASVMRESNLTASISALSMKPHPSTPHKNMDHFHVVPSSVPTAMARPIPMSLAMDFNNDDISKSWSDMFDEDEEDFQLPAAKNVPKWSSSSEVTPIAPEPAVSIVDVHEKLLAGGMTPSLAKANVDDDLVADGFFFHDSLDEEEAKQPSAPVLDELQPTMAPLRTIHNKRSTRNFDKWAALGERRRAYATNGDEHHGRDAGHRVRGEKFLPSGKSIQREHGFGMNAHHGKTQGSQPFTIPSSAPNDHYHNIFNMNNNANHRRNGLSPGTLPNWTKERAPMKECSVNWRRERRHAGLGDNEWSGGWNDVHV